MVIVIHSRFLNEEEPGDGGNYISEVIKKIAKQQSNHSFILLHTHSSFYENNLPQNVAMHIAGPKKQTPLSWLYWYNFKVPLLLKKLKADVFMTNDFCSFTTRVPQLLFSTNLSFLYQPLSLKKSQIAFDKKYVPRFLKKSSSAVTTSEFVKKLCIEKYKIPPNKIQVAYSAADKNYLPVSYLEREQVKEKYANGNEYFVSFGQVHPGSNLINLLKAFSAFKKRQKSGMLLLIASDSKILDKEFFLALKTFKFRDDVRVLEDVASDEHSKIVASAWGAVHIPLVDNFGSSLFNIMKCEVPIVTSSTGFISEIAGDNVLLANPLNFKEIAVQIMLLFKDEKLRIDLIAKGKKHLDHYNWDYTADNIWKGIQKAAGLSDSMNAVPG